MKLLVADAVHGGVLDGSREEVHLFEGGENVRAHSDAGERLTHFEPEVLVSRDLPGTSLRA